jgi:hypothetical protein
LWSKRSGEKSSKLANHLTATCCNTHKLRIKMSGKPCADCKALYSCYGKVTNLEEMACAWCGQKDLAKIQHTRKTPDHYGMSDFCIVNWATRTPEKSCFAKYGDFISKRNLAACYDMSQLSDGYTRLKYGLPYFITKQDPNKNSETMLRCAYCKVLSSDVIENVCMPSKYKHKVVIIHAVCHTRVLLIL